MLQQIIKEMYIEPDLLAELSDDQKQLIYMKIREEQVRRWTEVEEKLERETKVIRPPRKTGKAVEFLLGEDQNPWVWVMGEHRNDKSIDDIIEAEARAKARQKAEKEAEVIREREEKEAEEKLREEEKRLEGERIEQEKRLAAAAAAQRKQAENAQRLAQTQRGANKARQDIQKLKLVEQGAISKLRKPPLCKKHSTEGHMASVNDSGNISQPALSPEVLPELALTNTNDQTIVFDGEIFDLSSPKLPCDVNSCNFCFEEKSEKARINREESYRVLKEKRASEIMSAFHRTKALWEQKATEDSKQLDRAWQQQEKKAKQAESSLRRLVRGAREDYKRNSMRNNQDEVTLRTPRMSREVFRESAVLLGNALTAIKLSKPQSNRNPRPTSKEDIEKWFLEEEKPKKVGLADSGYLEQWFHGVIPRDQAEVLLSTRPVHSYLVRVSEKIWGYAISYKAEDRCKHYLVDTTENGGYQFFGTNQLEHRSLRQLILHHKNHPVSTAGQELLIFAVGQSKTPPDYADLFPEFLETTSL